ncbi:MAG TPA: tetratricopeptide repeat protein [Candidatus Lokiarchaeia archaeon]|nr:tetratricopeptide repeat protein [Candidatus Lokiarchaeia archaeon]
MSSDITSEEWALINAITYAGEDALQIRQIVQSYKTKQKADDNSIAQFLYMLGEKLFTRENCPKATHMFSAAIVMDPNLISAYLRKAESLDWRHKYEEALDLLKSAVPLFPTDVSVLKYLAELLEYQNAYAEAAEYYLKTIEVNPEDSQTYLKLLQLLDDHQMYNQLAQIAENVPIPTLDPRDLFRALDIFVNAFEKTADYEKALETADRALTLKPKRIALWEKKAKIYTILRQFSEAKKCLDQMVLIKPQAIKYQEKRDEYVEKHHLEGEES